MRALSLLLVLLLSPILVAAEAPFYIGIKQCKLCHQPHYDSWRTTHMSKAFDLLKANVRADKKRAAGLNPLKDYTADPACLACHTTGYGKEGGFVSLEKTPDMVNVQCEMCHGPGSIYVEMMLKKRGTYTREDYLTKGGMTMPSKESNICTTACHNQASPFINAGFEFNFENRKDIGTHRHDIEYIDNPLNF
ncbi:MAG: cytochrome c family protein [Candidatus Polarisedimenticolaceae bacterium]|nr:cytochrome c family protein [Candidatus Polarisedimenticolaceae bacterium]